MAKKTKGPVIDWETKCKAKDIRISEALDGLNGGKKSQPPRFGQLAGFVKSAVQALEAALEA
jgi:hypothetical protein